MEVHMFSCFMVVLCLVMARFSYATTNESEVVKHLNRLNKPPVKSIKSPDGDIIDCVHISQQPAFDHPSLKNHTIQMKPNFHPEGMKYESMKESSQTRETITQLWQLNGKCPKGTIPIRRTKKEDIIRAGSMKNYGKKRSLSTVAHPHSIDIDLINQSGHEHAIAYVEGEFYGAKASMNVWKPQIQQSNEFSLSQIWLLGGSFASDLNSIEAGWQVSPDLYGDRNTRLFTYWTVSSHSFVHLHFLQ
ncbi:hypothetical protein M8C21_017577 [Ambrosia artemisiifolia]|uniref:Neprosin PEP catalytic domain-containing protein n=1 Tax=Ambrosia artemisiifolia TaxID=4212 RepID=A0AAD5CEI2_AMBAR|nr:hypothetical protein M8C21_017577 [Ambrosia artemisiifolia]